MSEVEIVKETGQPFLCCTLSATRCALCHKPVCKHHRQSVQNYQEWNTAQMCNECAEDYKRYYEIFVNPRYPAG